MGEVLKASKLLKEDWGIDSDIWNVTSFSQLREEAESVARWNMMQPKKENKKSHLELCLDKDIPTIAVSDYIKIVQEQLSPYMTSPCLLYTSPSPRDRTRSRMPSSA